MTPSEFESHVQSLAGAADIVEAIDSPSLQDLRGWDLSRWRYDLIPWGVRFRFDSHEKQEPAEVVVVAGFHGVEKVGTLLEAGKVLARSNRAEVGRNEAGAGPDNGR